MKTVSTLFTGGDGFGVGAIAAGLTPLWGVEINPAIADWAERNSPGLSVIRANVTDVDYSGLECPWWLHMSPVCKNASVAKQGGEAPEDLAMAQGCIMAIEALQPPVVSLENVYGYREFQAFKSILGCLHQSGYAFDYWHLNAADYGGWVLCPLHDSASYVKNHWEKETAADIVGLSAMMRPEDQAKILAWDAVARLDKVTQLDIAESAIWQKMANVGNLEKLILTGKADATLTIEGMSRSGLVDDIGESIEWLLKRCLDASSIRERWSITSMEIRRITVLKILRCFLATKNISLTTTGKEGKVILDGELETSGLNDCPLCKFTAVPQTRKRLILIARKDRFPTRPEATHTEGGEAAGLFGPGLLPWVGWYEAIEDLIPGLPESRFAKWQLERLPMELKTMLVSGENAGQEWGRKFRDKDDPGYAVSANGTLPHAFILGNGQRSAVNGADLPVDTITSNSNQTGVRTFVVDGKLSTTTNGQKILQINNSDQPSGTIVSSESAFRDTRAYTNGRVVSMTPRALARFQSFPDNYQLPDKKSLACEIIGNAVPPLLAESIVRSQCH